MLLNRRIILVEKVIRRYFRGFWSWAKMKYNSLLRQNKFKLFVFLMNNNINFVFSTSKHRRQQISELFD